MMKKGAAIFAILALCSAPVLAQTGGFSGPGAMQQAQDTQQSGGFVSGQQAVTTVAKAKDLSDNSWVVLQGNIEQRVRGDHYTFRDATGTIEVEIDHKYWNGQTITPKDKVEIQGEIDKDWSTTKIDVKRLHKMN
ncbi:OB fold stress tolerance protein YgiW [Edwardsiella ictaluri]|nr:OB fold stress tolerance protein YgiW [Edwardsiella ictaluri]BEI01221.1 OB fold stress tolerance protein YgiW [Edwardsiella ictaluri]BEI11631.1 OB fold stress tolerance protein YgiW [Edwardsiella ictaluri]BEI15108.1 OB fold stress tolerance protein YgiW [Edwardsiella ictaluri]